MFSWIYVCVAFELCLRFVWKSAKVEDQEKLTVFVKVCRLTLLLAVLLFLVEYGDSRKKITLVLKPFSHLDYEWRTVDVMAQ